jgi:tetraacyldisaccharide 4'-kinase
MYESGFIHRLWYGSHPLSVVLMPIGWLYCIYMKARMLLYSAGLLPKNKVKVPVIVVGNITVGGTGKTPLVIWLCNYLVEQGYKPGIISRGYGGQNCKWPQQVRADSDPHAVGDEAVLLAQRTRQPVAVSHYRYLAAVHLLEYCECDVLLCDDGLQNLSLDRDLEIAVIDGDRRFGNGNCLPAGPLRESVSRLLTVDLVVAKHQAEKNEHLMQYNYKDLVSVNDENQYKQLASLCGKTIHAISGIADPRRFHSYLKENNINLIKHIYPDHYKFSLKNLQFEDDFPIVMTEKDAVKCREFSVEHCWYLPIDVEFNDAFHFRITKLLGELLNG